MNLKDFHKVYFLGIGGIGMSALARWFHHAGYQVSGYDKTPSDITRSLQNEGIGVIFTDSVQEIPALFRSKSDVLVIFTPAIPKEHEGYKYFMQNGFHVIKRSLALGLLTKDKAAIAVAGTHGKTSISTAISWLMNNTCSAFLGGISKNLTSNVIINSNANYVVVEADEYDRSFLTLYPTIAVISAMDADHLEIYENTSAIIESFYQFIQQIKPQGTLIYKKGLAIPGSINKEIRFLTYSLDNPEADFYTKDIQVQNGVFHFTWVTPTDTFPGFVLGIPGLYNLENAVAALAASYIANVSIDLLKNRLDTFQGVHRRFDFQIRTSNLIFIDDYAHHPEEIKACIRSVRYMFPEKRITAVFQPHLFSRTRDFGAEFAQSLDEFDQIILLPIYPARELPISGITSQLILDRMKLNNKELCSYDELVPSLLQKDLEVLVTMGAGDIDRLIVPLKAALIEKYHLA